MSYIPPHKRQSKDLLVHTSSSLQDYLIINPKKNIDLNTNTSEKVNIITYSQDAIARWVLVRSNGTDQDDVVPYTSLKLVHASSHSSECIYWKNYLLLMNNNVQKEEEGKTQWMLVAEKIENDLVFAYEQAMKKMEDPNQEYNAKLRLAARFGKNVFYGKTFSTNVTTSYIQNIKTNVAPSHDFSKDMDEESYIVKISHCTSPQTMIRCKCKVKENGRLVLYKAELSPLRHMVIDVSCIDKDLDMRLMLARKRKLTALTEEEMNNIQGLLDFVIIDRNAKSGLRWPNSKYPSKNGYKISEFCHAKATIYKSRSFELKLRETDSSNVGCTRGEVEKGVTLILQEINTKLQDKNVERGCVLEMLRDALGIMWDFLSFDSK
ncbi:unnamed protein product [Cochlearia groenlandica]